MTEQITLKARTLSYLVLQQIVEEEYLDNNSSYVGTRHRVSKPFEDAMVVIRQGTDYELNIHLMKPDGTPFDLTGATTIRTGIFQTTPTSQQIALVAGSVSGNPLDGNLVFSLTTTDTGTAGYFECEVDLLDGSGKKRGFEGYKIKVAPTRLT
jgi:hypothetical protein